ncbi:MAG: hypothetical protein MI749_19020 [Desulfovibrionales bacterium]|nr:hypothetical protein [Desulfovibrionales bacterium]
MHYLKTMGNLLSFNAAILPRNTSLKKLQYYCIFNVLILGLIYGVSAALLADTLLQGQGLVKTNFNGIKVVVAGIPVAFLMHGGMALFAWVFMKAMGGTANFVTAYFYMGTALISLWPLAPFAAALQMGMITPLTKGFGLLFALYGFAVTVGAAQSAFQLSKVKMALATLVTVSYIGCFLYLWT